MGRGCACVTAGRDARRADRCRGRSGRPHRDASRPHPPGPSRGVRGGRHGDARSPPGRRRSRDAGQSSLREHDLAPLEGRAGFAAVQVPRSRQCRGHRAVPRDLQRREAAPQRLRGLGRVDVRPPRVPLWLGEPLHHDAALAPVAPRSQPHGARVQRRAHRRRPQRPRHRARGRRSRTSSPRPVPANDPSSPDGGTNS